jgi:hypothetical protein
MEAKMVDITLGETVCEKLKALYFKDSPWPECYQQVADRFTELKRHARQFYAGQGDVDILKELIKYSTHDIDEMYHIEHATRKVA